MQISSPPQLIGSGRLLTAAKQFHEYKLTRRRDVVRMNHRNFRNTIRNLKKKKTYDSYQETKEAITHSFRPVTMNAKICTEAKTSSFSAEATAAH